MVNTKHFLIGYTGTKAEITALTPVAPGSMALATDTDESGFYDGAAWVWSESPVITSFLNANHTHAAAGATGGVVDHVNTSNKQGGTTGEYYHLTSADSTEAVAFLDGGTSTHTAIDDGLLTSTQKTDLTDTGLTTLHKHIYSDIILSHGGDAGVPGAGTPTTRYIMPGFAGLQAAATNSVWPKGGTIKNAYLRTGTTQPATGSLVCTLVVENADTSIVITVAAGAIASVFSDTAHTATVLAGYRYRWKVVNNASTTSATVSSLTVELEQESA